MCIKKRLSEISSDEQTFNSFKKDYEQALLKSGHKPKLEYNPPTPKRNTRNKQRKRNIIWFTPPHSSALKTNLGKQFLNIVDKNFPISNPLHKIINRKTSTTPSCNGNRRPHR